MLIRCGELPLDPIHCNNLGYKDCEKKHINILLVSLNSEAFAPESNGSGKFVKNTIVIYLSRFINMITNMIKYIVSHLFYGVLHHHEIGYFVN